MVSAPELKSVSTLEKMLVQRSVERSHGLGQLSAMGSCGAVVL